MSIASQLPPIPLAQASAMLRAMAQVNGQNVEARVVGQLPDGAIQVQIGRQVMSLHLPAPQPVGTTLTLAVQQAEGQVRMALLAIRPPSTPTGSNAMPAAEGPATSVQLSAAALSGRDAPLPPIAGQAASATTPLVSSSTQSAVLSSAPALSQSIPAASAEPAAPPGMSVAGAAGRPAIPYAIAAPAMGPGPAAAIAGSATTALPPVPPSAAAGNIGQQGSSSIAQNATGMTAGGQGAPLAAMPTDSRAVLTQMVQQALPRQDSVVGLTMALANVVGRVALPEAVMKAAQQVLTQRLSLDGAGPDGAALQKAVRNSGIFQEAMLAAGLGKAAGGDLKSTLLGLQRQLGGWLGDQDAVEQVRAIPPPLRGMIPRAKAENPMLGDLPDDSQAVGKVLLDRTEAALSRLRLHQHASLPEPVARHEAQWNFDMPVVLGGQQSLLHMQIHRDAEGDAERPEDRGWQVRFAINLSEWGEVGAQISLRGAATGVLLWADREDIAAMLGAGVDDLRQQIEAAGLLPGAIVVRAGAPAAPAPAPAAASGNIVDAVG
ncbi:flagellar hook-length control protein FliK [Devosia sp. YIM 151766]|uniref:flagellar hook-length control protein FliK n=1 Tax=Devosia sp. YIM 151766 TaxID=3017325 RepID=UPI00255CCCA6|nr:flagellar hook-length control protein FliK [Devosia sp. YIM 151766]WIY54270.1 flagellar hook-length control protein FliK [Devosia sp. YIM 151766]